MATSLKQVEKFVKENIPREQQEKILEKAKNSVGPDGMIQSGLVDTFLGEKTKNFLNLISTDPAYIDIAIQEIIGKKK